MRRPIIDSRSMCRSCWCQVLLASPPMAEEHGARRRGSYQSPHPDPAPSNSNPRGVRSTVTRDGDIVLEGWLKKRGTRIQSLWSERYFILKGDQLVYYLKQGDAVSNSSCCRISLFPCPAPLTRPRPRPLPSFLSGAPRRLRAGPDVHGVGAQDLHVGVRQAQAARLSRPLARGGGILGFI